MTAFIGLNCYECSFPMLGIHSYRVRDCCEPCGGEAKIDADPDKLPDLKLAGAKK